eukprot:43302-Chlamydomonas_euryale.AAC.3
MTCRGRYCWLCRSRCMPQLAPWRRLSRRCAWYCPGSRQAAAEREGIRGAWRWRQECRPGRAARSCRFGRAKGVERHTFGFRRMLHVMSVLNYTLRCEAALACAGLDDASSVYSSQVMKNTMT